MGRAKKIVQPPQSAEDIELAKQTITAAFEDAVERRRAELADAQAVVVRLQREVGVANARRTAWVGDGEIDEDRAFDAHSFATRDMHALARRVTSLSVRLDPNEVEAARRKHEVVKRFLADRNLLPAALVDPIWRPNR